MPRPRPNIIYNEYNGLARRGEHCSPAAATPVNQPDGQTARASNARPYNRIGKLRQPHDSPAGWGHPALQGNKKHCPRDFTAKQKRGGHCPASFFIKRRRKTERLAVSCNETEPTPLQADALPSDPAGRSGIPLLYRTMGMFFVPVLSFDAYIVHDFCRNCKGLRCTMCCKIYVYFCATCPIF